MAVTAGSRITASGTNALARVYARKTADQSVSNTTLTNDTQLVLALNTNKSYEFDLRIFYTGAATGSGDIHVGYTLPTGATAYGRFAGPVASAGAAFQYGIIQYPGTFAFGSNGAIVMVLEIAGTIDTSSTAGNLQIQFAQNTSSGTATTVKAKSRLFLTDIT